jgi:hypothetical protein
MLLVNSSDDLQQLIDQLPFYVNGTLDTQMRLRIDAALPVSPRLQEALAQEQRLRSDVRTGTEAIVDESAPRFAERTAQVMEQVTPAAAVQPEPQRQGFAAAMAFLNPRRWNPAVALTLALALPAQAAVIASQSSTIAKLEKENFELASGPCADRDRTHGVILQLKDDAKWQAVSALLDTEGLVISESAAFGVLTVRGEVKGEARTKLIERLRQSPLVASAEPEA